jgi:hypothetical protein
VPPARRSLDADAGQASVELVAAVPVLLLAGLVAWQLALAGHALWASANAARVGARAALVGRDARAAALSALPERLRRGARVERREGAVRVRVALRVPLPGAGDRRAWVGARAGLGEAEP